MPSIFLETTINGVLKLYSNISTKYYPNFNIYFNFSPSNLTGKKSNEIIQGGISSLKSAATSVAKKLDEIKEAISTTSTPVKVITSGNERTAAGDTLETSNVGEGDSTDGSEGGERRVSAELGSYKGSVANLRDLEETLPDNLYPSTCDTNLGKYCLKFYLTCKDINL